MSNNDDEVPDDEWLLAHQKAHKCMGCGKIADCTILKDISKVEGKYEIRIDFRIGVCKHRISNRR